MGTLLRSNNPSEVGEIAWRRRRRAVVKVDGFILYKPKMEVHFGKQGKLYWQNYPWIFINITVRFVTLGWNYWLVKGYFCQLIWDFTLVVCGYVTVSSFKDFFFLFSNISLEFVIMLIKMEQLDWRKKPCRCDFITVRTTVVYWGGVWNFLFLEGCFGKLMRTKDRVLNLVWNRGQVRVLICWLTGHLFSNMILGNLIIIY